MDKPACNIHIDKSVSYTDEDLTDIISCCICDIGYWACIDNDSNEWWAARRELPKDATIEDIILHILKNGERVTLIDVEDDEEFWILTFDDFIKGIKMVIQSGDWDGDVYTLDGAIGDEIFQYALFNEIVFG